MNYENCSNPTPERLNRAGDDLETGDDKRGTLLLRLLDYPLAQARLREEITLEQFETGERFHGCWYHAGLAGYVPAIDGAGCIVVGGDNFGGMPRNNFEHRNRLKYREYVQTMGVLTSRVVELIVCWRNPIEAVNLGWPGALGRLRDGLNKISTTY